MRFCLALVFFYCASLYGWTIRNIEISGNEKISDQEIMEQLAVKEQSEIDITKLREIGKSVSDIYESNKIYNVVIKFPTINPVNRSELDLFIEIVEHDEIQINAIQFEGNKYFSTKKILELTKFDSVEALTFSNLNDFMEDIAQLYQLRGYLFINIKLKEIVKTDAYVAIFTISEGKRCHFTDYKFSGNKHTKDSSLLKFSGLTNINKFNLDILKKAETNIRNKEYIKDCRVIPVNEKTLEISVNEGNMTKFSFLMGYDNNKSGSTKDRLSGNVDVTFLNLYGTDRSLDVHWHSNSANSNINFEYHESGPERYPIAGDFSFGRTEKDSTQIVNSFSTEIFYYTLKNKYGIFAGIDDYFPGSARPKLEPKKQDKKIGFLWEFSNLDNTINATEGIFLNAKYYKIYRNEGVLEGINDKEVSLSSDVLELDFDKYILFWKNHVSFQSYHLRYIANHELESNYKLGGIKSLRGFTDDQFEGNTIAWMNQEWRYLLSLNTRAFVFLDYGFVENNEDGNTNRLTDLLGFGLGLRIETKLGLFGLDYGLNYHQGKIKKPADGILHFGIVTSL